MGSRKMPPESSNFFKVNASIMTLKRKYNLELKFELFLKLLWGGRRLGSLPKRVVHLTCTPDNGHMIGCASLLGRLVDVYLFLTGRN